MATEARGVSVLRHLEEVGWVEKCFTWVGVTLHNNNNNSTQAEVKRNKNK